MHCKKYSNFTAPSKNRPKVLKLPKRNINSSGIGAGDCTPKFQDDLNGRSLWNFPETRAEVVKRPKLLPPLQPLLHSPRSQGEFVFKGKADKKNEQFLATFRAIQGCSKKKSL